MYKVGLCDPLGSSAKDRRIYTVGMLEVAHLNHPLSELMCGQWIIAQLTLCVCAGDLLILL